MMFAKLIWSGAGSTVIFGLCEFSRVLWKLSPLSPGGHRVIYSIGQDKEVFPEGQGESYEYWGQLTLVVVNPGR